MVTAWHVLEGFREAKRLHPETLLAVNIGDGNTIAIPEPRVLAESRHLDLATIEFPQLEWNAECTTKSYFPLDRCPPIRATEGEPVTIVGFPGQGRHEFETFGLFEPYPITMCVTSVSDRRVTLVDERGDLRIERNGRHLVEGITLGGFSGSPAFALTIGEPRLNLVGVVSTGSVRLGCVDQPGQVVIGSAEYLLPDGRLDQLRMPW